MKPSYPKLTSKGEGYEKIEPQDAQGANETTRFKDKRGNETVVLTYREIDLGENQKKRINPVTGAEDIIGEGEVDYEGEIAASPEVAEITDRLTDSAESYFTYEPLTTSSEAIYKAFMMKYFSKVEKGSEEDKSDGEINGKALIRKEIYIVADEYSQVLPVLYTENSSITEAEMMQAVNSFEKIDEPMLYRPKGTAEMYVDNENGVGIQGGAYDAKALFTDYLDNYVDTIMPQEMDIKSYKIHRLEEAVPVGDVAGIIDEGMIEGETAPWDIIYPTAKVYKIDYELIPAKPDKFHDVAGGGFDITKEGSKRYRESYGVFYSYSLDGKTYEAVFWGFLHPASMGEWGVDYSVLRTINDWYDYEVFPKVLEKAKVKYVGNASEVGRLIGLLPLSEYSDGIALQTTKEPYNVTVNYKIGTEDIHDSQVGGVLSPLPKADGNQKRIHSSVEGQENYMNRYIAAQAMENNKKLMAAIDNLGSATVAASSPYVKEEVSLTLRRDDWK